MNKILILYSGNQNGIVGNPCIPKGYKLKYLFYLFILLYVKE